MAGTQITKDHLDQVAVDLALRIRTWLTDVQNLQRGLTGWDATRITALGYTDEDANVVIQALLSAVKLRAVAIGADTLPTPVDLTEALFRLTGID